MKNYFKSEIVAKPFFKTYILFWLPLLILGVMINRTDETMPLLSTLASLAESWLSMLLWFAVFTFAIQFVQFKEKPLGFSGRLGEYAPKLLKWYCLTIITLGIYGPWMIRNMADYYLGRLSYEEKTGEFLSNPGRLLKYMLLTVYLPVLVLTAIFIFFMIRNMDYATPSFEIRFGLFTLMFVVLMFLVIVPFLFYYLNWLINVSFGSNRIEFRRGMSELAGFIIPQILLSIITIGIYYPAAMIKIYRFIIEGSVFCDESGVEKGGFGFDGETGKGFGLLWGQGLLTLITAGIYAPWAIAKVGNWWLNNTCIEEQG